LPSDVEGGGITGLARPFADWSIPRRGCACGESGTGDLIACWTLVDDDWALVGNKRAATRLGFAALLKFFELEARFPRHVRWGAQSGRRLPGQAGQCGSSLFDEYTWSGRTIEYHRAQIRAALGFHEPTVADEDNLAVWLAEDVCPVELSKRMVKRQQMRWTLRGAHLLLQLSTRVLNEELADVFRLWYPEFDGRGNKEELAA
jgi:hypothetical protein